MTCADVRDRLVDLVDERLERVARAETARARGERPADLEAGTTPHGREPGAEIEEHLAACAECREELARVEHTVALLQAVELPRAPGGFVDRVLERVRPPWYRRLTHALLSPLHVKLPLEAAAILLVSVGVVYVFHRMPELQDAARVAPGVPVRPAPPPGMALDGDAQSRIVPLESSETGAPARDRPRGPTKAPREVPDPARFDVGSGRAAGGDLPARRAEDLAERRDPGERGGAAARHAPAVTPPAAPAVPSTASSERRPREEPAQGHVVPPLSSAEGGAPPAAPPTPASPPAADVGAQMAARIPAGVPDRTEASRRTTPAPAHRAAAPSTAEPAPASTAASARADAAVAKRPASLADVRGRLVVTDLAEAERRLHELAASHGATATRRDHEDATVVLEFALAQPSYAELTHALPALGRWTPEREASPLPARVRLEIRLER